MLKLSLLCLALLPGLCAWEQFYKEDFVYSDLEGMCLGTLANRVVYCEGPLLEAVNIHRIYNDSKDFVDRPLKQKPDVIMTTFRQRFNASDIKSIDKKTLSDFVDEFFYNTTSELKECVPKDWKENPPKIMKIQDPKLRKWALDLHGIWKDLCRTIDEDVKTNPDMHSILWMNEPFIVPGGRFREAYYSDSYWIIKGLIVSDMIETAKSITRNFKDIVNTYGMIPNGLRVYYTNRSQPPLFGAMVYSIYEATGDKDYIQEMLPALELEFQWWEQNRKFPVTSQNNNTQYVYFYKTNTTLPRPESLWADLSASAGLNATQKAVFLESAASAAESGWDFSSRWFADQKTLSTMETINFAPVDLNSYLCGDMQIIGFLYREIGNVSQAKKYEDMHHDFIWTHDDVFYNHSARGWYDFNTRTKQHRVHNYPSVAVPLFTNCYTNLDVNKPQRLFENLHETGFFNYSGGVPASMIQNTSQQWDFPNGWAPLNHMLIEGLRQAVDPIMQDEAFNVATKWIYGNYRVYAKSKQMYEKYDVEASSTTPGGGGEYAVVAGFGWSNGVILDILHSYYDRIQAPPEASNSSSGLFSCTFLIVIALSKLLF